MKHCLFASVFLISLGVKAQKTLSVRISTADDDQEEWIKPISGQTQSKTIGNLDPGSSDLEFGTESTGNDPQMVGLRFTNINIPKGSIILSAYIQFTVDAVSKNNDPCKVFIKGENTDSSKIFEPSIAYNITSRNKTSDSIVWDVTGATWNTVGSATLDQRTPNIKALIQAIIDRQGWKQGNPATFFLYGTGTREVESFDGDAPKAPMLVINYVEPLLFSSRIAAADDDQEEFIPAVSPQTQSKTIGSLDAGSSDLEFGTEASGNDPQMVGMRFTNINIPKGALITNAYIQFTVDAIGKNNNPCNIILKGEASDSSKMFEPLTSFNITSRKKTADSVLWSVSGTTWNTVGAATIEQRTPNIKALVQSIINQNNWKQGNPVTIFMHGTGTREVESFDGDAAKAPLLVIEYIGVQSMSIRVNAADDDQEEWIPAKAPQTQSKIVGDLDPGSSDLEFGTESTGNDPQMVGIRFNNIKLPQGAIIQNAYIQFTVDAVGKNNDPCVVYIKGEDNDTPSIFKPTVKFNITSRVKTADSVTWNVSGSTWSTVGSATADQRTPNLKSIIEKITSRKGWMSGNSMAFFLYGKGTREVESYDGDAPKAPQLVIEYLGGNNGMQTKPKIPLTTYPVTPKSNWSYFDSGYVPKGSWKNNVYKVDTTWSFGVGPLGYGELGYTGTDLASGPTNNKFITHYFRKPFTVTTSQLTDTIELKLMCDDGAVVYINGVEVARKNMASGTVLNNTKAKSKIDEPYERLYWLYYLPKSVLKSDTNVIAVEVHQSDSLSSDMLFDIALNNRIYVANPPSSGCVGASGHISCFTSVIPTEQTDTISIPQTHHFQVFAKTGDPYTKGSTLPSNFDFTGYVPSDGNSKKGIIALNHEKTPGGVSLIDVHFNCVTGFWEVDSSVAVDFGGELVLTSRNCSGGITPWGTAVTCEEDAPIGDANADGYEDIGWNIEIDPKTRRVKEYGNGKREKLWAMGRMSHENIVFKQDSITSYFGEDEPNGSVYKFVASKKADLSSGTLYALKLDNILDASGDPTSTTGKWVIIPNTTKIERNTVKQSALSLASTFNGVEDVEISPTNNDIYFAAKGVGRTYRFTDNGSTISNFQTFVGGKTYPINYGTGIIAEDWSGGNDNLTFDDKGNLYVLQDGGRNHVWMVRPDHTQTKPRIELFMTTPIGSEPTGMTFTPDFKYMFISIQEPNGKVVQKDVKGSSITYDRSTAMVIARKENFKPTPINAPVINGPTTAQKGTTQNYSVPKNNGSTYAWTIINGTQTGGSNSNAISVLWSASASAGEVNVIETVNQQCVSANTKINVTLQATTDIKRINGNSDIRVYPNPAAEILHIDLNGSSMLNLNLIDITGKLIIQKIVNPDNNTLNISEIPSGIYMLSATGTSGNYTFQIIKK
ncbi:MAG: hypothetical protein RIT07_874 [Bacteroidota bacterium]